MATASDDNRPLNEVLPDFPKGPLTPYRDQASFDWRKMKLSIDDEEIIRYKSGFWRFFENNPLFQHSPVTLPLDELRHQTFKRMVAMKKGELLPFPRALLNSKVTSAWTEGIFMCDIDAGVKLGINYNMFVNTIKSLGTEKHDDLATMIYDDEIFGCFALTEIAHGSNAKGMRTTATYDPKTKEYIVDSADFAAAKCWVGNLGQCATHAIVYAKLITADGQDHGLHAFVVPVRCPKTLRPYPGVVVGDMGEKIALNGIDNGFVMFNKYRVSRDALLNKLGDVDDSGKYVSPLRDPSKRFGASLGALSGGRVQIAGMAACNIQKAIAIAVRYSAVRKQFGPENSSEEYSVIEYQQQQFRLIPYVAATYAARIFANWISETHTKFVIDSFSGGNTDEDGALKGIEMHALSSGAKPTVSWLTRDGIQVCRESCGGHGYLQATGLGKIRNENDANCTYEGENSVLIQQTSNWLLGQWRSIEKGEKIRSPYNTARYLNDNKKILSSKLNISSTADAVNPKNLLDAYKYLVCYTLKLTAEKAARLTSEGKDTFAVRNDIQAYHAATLSVVYVEHVILNTFYEFAQNVQDRNSREVLLKLVSLYGAWSLEKHLTTLYIGGYLSGNAGQLVRNGVVELCLALKPEAVSLVDVLAPPDFTLNSILGKSDGRAYENIQTSFFSYPGSLTRPDWWRDVVKWDTTTNSKL